MFENFERTLDFSLHNALALARASKLAYPMEREDGRKETPSEWRERARGELDQAGLHDTAFFDANDTQAFLAANDDKMVLSFRGTEMDIDDIATDLNFDKVGGPLEGRVHEGFLLALLSVWAGRNGIRRALREFRAERKSKTGRAPALYITGHSLGAALATLAAAKLAEAHQPVWGVYTFGSPRVGDPAFAKSYNAALKPITMRVGNNNDLVTRIPTRGMEFSHVGRYFYLKESGECVEDPGSWMLWLDKLWGRVADIGELGIDALKDHKIDADPDGYIPALLNNI